MSGTAKTKGADSLAEAYGSIFDLEGGAQPGKLFLLDAIKFAPEDVLTGKLKLTMAFYKALEKNKLAILPPEVRDQERVFGIFQTIAVLSYLARTRFANVRKPGFWVRDVETMSVVPAFPVDLVSEVVGLPPATLRACMVPFVKDQALEFVRSPEGVAAILLKPGFIEDSHLRRFLKV